MHWLTTILILLPIAGALVVWSLPLSPFAAGSTALLVSLVELEPALREVEPGDGLDPDAHLGKRDEQRRRADRERAQRQQPDQQRPRNGQQDQDCREPVHQRGAAI